MPKGALGNDQDPNVGVRSRQAGSPSINIYNTEIDGEVVPYDTTIEVRKANVPVTIATDIPGTAYDGVPGLFLMSSVSTPAMTMSRLATIVLTAFRASMPLLPWLIPPRPRG